MSQENYLKGLSETARREYMEANAHRVEDTRYSKPLTEEDIAECKTAVSENCIKFNDLDEEFSEIKKEFKGKMKPLAEHNKILLNEIRTRQRLVAGVIWHMPNYEDSQIETYNGEGEMISSRRMKPEEKQGNLYAISKAN